MQNSQPLFLRDDYRMTQQKPSSISPTPEKSSRPEFDYQKWLDSLSKADLERMARQQARAERVGALLHEVHYLLTSRPHPKWDQKTVSEHQFFIDYALSAPGLCEQGLRDRIAQLKRESLQPPALEPKTDE